MTSQIVCVEELVVDFALPLPVTKVATVFYAYDEGCDDTGIYGDGYFAHFDDALWATARTYANEEYGLYRTPPKPLTWRKHHHLWRLHDGDSPTDIVVSDSPLLGSAPPTGAAPDEQPQDADIQAAREWLAELSENIRSYHQSIPGQPGCTCGRSLACGNDLPDYAAIWTLEAALNAWTPAEEDQQPQDARPRVVCLCGSSRFRAEHDAANRDLTLAGHIVLGLGTFSHSDGTVLSDAEKAALDKLHLAKIDLADEVVVVSPGGYIGASTAAEIAYAEKRGKPVRYLTDSVTAPASAQDERDGDVRAVAKAVGILDSVLDHGYAQDAIDVRALLLERFQGAIAELDAREAKAETSR